MKFYFYFLVLLLCCLLLSKSANGQEILQIGEFNGLPGSATAKLLKTEFSFLSCLSSTIHVKSKNAMPQRIIKNQRIALFVNSIINKEIPKGKKLTLKLSLTGNASWGQRSSVSILFNKHLLWKAFCTHSPQIISLFIPVSYIEKDTNIIQIINGGPNTIAFDAISLATQQDAGSDGIADNAIGRGYSIFSKSQSESIFNQIQSKLRLFSPRKKRFQLKLLDTIPFKVAQCLYYSEGKPFDLLKVVRIKELYDPLSGKRRRIPFEPIIRISDFFSGNPKLIPSCLLPVATNEFIQCASWCAARNSKSSISVLCSTRLKAERGKEVQIILPIDWKHQDGTPVKAQLEFVSGYSDNLEPLEKRIESVLIKGGTFNYKFKLSRCVFIRLTKKNAKKPLRVRLPDKIEIKRNKPKRLTVVKTRIPSKYIRQSIHHTPGVINTQGPNYIGKRIPATRSTINGIDNIVPWDAKSPLIEITCSKKSQCLSGGATLYVGGIPDNFSTVDFWVYPKSSLQKKIS